MSNARSAALAVLAIAITMAAALSSQPKPPPTPRADTASARPPAQDLRQAVTRVGCLTAWQPGEADATKSAQAATTGTYVLTPINVNAVKATEDLPTYVLVGEAAVNFGAHLNHEVEIAGVEHAAMMPPTVQETVNAPSLKAGNTPATTAMPSLTVRSLKTLSTTCG